MSVEMTKVVLNGADADEIETLWAIPLGNDHYKLDNSPFFAYGVSWEDVVEARAEEDGFPEFVAVVQKSGNRTVRIIFEKGSFDSESKKVMKHLQELSCSYEGMPPRLLSVNVPPEADLTAVAEYLTNVPGLQWEYADPSYAEVTGEHSEPGAE
jgi:hypothetical protein